MGYDVVSRVFHWLTVLLVGVMIPVGWIMTQELPRTTQNLLFMIHKGLGVVVLTVVVLRLAWCVVRKPAPPLPASVPSLQARMAKLAHIGLYAFLVIMAVSGYVRVMAGGFPIELLNAIGVPPLIGKNEWLANVAKAIHGAAIFGLMALIAVHVGAAAYHAMIKRDGVFERMWPPFRRKRQAVQR